MAATTPGSRVEYYQRMVVKQRINTRQRSSPARQGFWREQNAMYANARHGCACATRVHVSHMNPLQQRRMQRLTGGGLQYGETRAASAALRRTMNTPRQYARVFTAVCVPRRQ